jgi:hypothetical protein
MPIGLELLGWGVVLEPRRHDAGLGVAVRGQAGNYKVCLKLPFEGGKKRKTRRVVAEKEGGGVACVGGARKGERDEDQKDS